MSRTRPVAPERPRVHQVQTCTVRSQRSGTNCANQVTTGRVRSVCTGRTRASGRSRLYEPPLCTFQNAAPARPVEDRDNVQSTPRDATTHRTRPVGTPDASGAHTAPASISKPTRSSSELLPTSSTASPKQMCQHHQVYHHLVHVC